MENLARSQMFQIQLYTTKDWKKVIKILRQKSKDELINLIDVVLKEAYDGVLPYPYYCCDFASDFGYMIFKELGYEVKVQRFFDDEIGEHNFLLVDNEIVDFTNKQFDPMLPVKIKDKNLLQYSEAEDNKDRNEGLSNLTFGRFTEMARDKVFVGLLNYRPFSHIISKLLYSK